MQPHLVVWGLGFGVWGLGVGGWGLGFEVCDLSLRALGFGLNLTLDSASSETRKTQLEQALGIARD